MQLLLIHPNADSVEDLSAAFTYDGYDVLSCTTLKRAEEVLQRNTVDMTILTDEMEDGNVLDFFTVLEAAGALPAMILTRSTSVKHIVLLLEYGYREVVRLPMDILEVKARVRAMLRSQSTTKEAEEDPFRIELFGLQIDMIHRILQHEEKSVQLTSKEFEVLLVLIREKGKVLSRADLARELWTEIDAVHERNIDVYVRRLREKLNAIEMDELIATKWGEGYLLHSIDPLYRNATELSHALGEHGEE